MNRTTRAQVASLLGALAILVTLIGTGASGARWSETVTVDAPTVTFTLAGHGEDPSPPWCLGSWDEEGDADSDGVPNQVEIANEMDPCAPSTDCPPGYTFDLFALQCIADTSPDRTDPTVWQCNAQTPLPQWEMVNSVPATCVDPSGVRSPYPAINNGGNPPVLSCANPGDLPGRWTHYRSDGTPFREGDQQVTVTVALPAAWVARATTAPFMGLQILIDGQPVDTGGTNVWTATFSTAPGPGQYLLDPTDPIDVSVAVNRATGSASGTELWPAYLLVMADITDADGQVRRLSGVTETIALHQGSHTASCGDTFWTWTQSELDALGYE